MPNPPTESEQWFDQYLNDHGYAFQVEPDLGIQKRPDRLIEREGIRAICEVKQPENDAIRRRWPQGGAQIGSFSTDEWLRNVRRPISRAARQLEELAGDERPLVIVLANPQGVVADIEGPKLIEAMQGDLTVTFDVKIQTGHSTSDPEWTLGENGRLAGERAPWVSAVIGLHRGDHREDWIQAWIEQWNVGHWPEGPPCGRNLVTEALARGEELEEAMQREDIPTGHYFRADVVEAFSDTAVPLPRTIFNGERDRRWVANKDSGTYRRLA